MQTTNQRKGFITTVYLPEKHRFMLEKLRADLGIGMSELMRQLIAREYAEKYDGGIYDGGADGKE